MSIQQIRENAWSEEEKLLVRENYAEASKEEFKELLPERTWNAIQRIAKSLNCSRLDWTTLRDWSPKDLSILQRSYSNVSAEILVKELSRRWEAIQAKARSMGLTRSLKEFYGDVNRFIVSSRWSSKEVEELQQAIFQEKSAEDLISSFPKRTWGSIYYKCRELGFDPPSKIPFWSSDEETVLIESYYSKPMHWLIGNLPGRTESAIYQRAVDLGLSRKPQRFKREELMRYYLDKLFPVEIKQDNVFPKFLEKLQYDRYYPNLKLAFEHNGLQHYQPWGSSSQEILAFEKTQKRDLRKKELSKQLGITLIVIKYDDELDVESLKQRIQAIRSDIILNSDVLAESIEQPEGSNDYWWDEKDDKILREHWATATQNYLVQELASSWNNIRSRVQRKLPEIFELREKRLREGDWTSDEMILLKQGVEQRLTDQQISELFTKNNFTRTVNGIQRKRDIEDLGKRLSSFEIWTLDNLNWVKENYNLPREEIENYLGCDWQTIRKKLEELGIKRLRTGNYTEKEIGDIDLALKEGKSHREISEILERSFSSVATFIQDNGVKRGWTQKREEVAEDYSKEDDDLIKRLYEERKSQEEITKALNEQSVNKVVRSKASVYARMRRLGCCEERKTESTKWSSQDIDDLRKYILQGKSCREIAIIMERTLASVRRSMFKNITSKTDL